MAGIAVCKDCGGSGKVTMLRFDVDCDCVKNIKSHSDKESGPQDFDPDKLYPGNGWYSAKMENQEGAFIYKLAGSEQEVKATIITHTKTHNVGWDDVEFVGIVDKYIRKEK